MPAWPGSKPSVPNLKLKWAFAFPNALRTRSQPAIAMGAVFVGSQDGTVYAFDLETGCERWSFQASAEVRTAIVLKDAEDDAGAPTAFFGDILARVYAVNALTGELLWSLKVDDHPSATITGAPALAGEGSCWCRFPPWKWCPPPTSTTSAAVSKAR